ncbi:hypothetical protein [Bacteroides reticulotermitis]|uniref:Uncharacterized protein n=2 Tax=Bacteroides reticulotermitis TaxID=1133319 RepID=W4US98_9BACE|nr:hypothetical protein [Bacteroides reticulotermitis]MBB4043882.1 hypothetical protein [Bacteroides reticulotermitis]GAE83389.1 hypothetical protein JCM10512_1659 [Bacteroides reticulotermitis JCM 10512]
MIKFDSNNKPVLDEEFLQYEKEWHQLRKDTIEYGNKRQEELDEKFGLTDFQKACAFDYLAKAHKETAFFKDF